MLISDKDLARIAEHVPIEGTEDCLVRAAVAIILRDGERGTEFLLMQRAIHDNDPWSGQISFPGGKIDPKDNSAKAAAIREADEEVNAKLVEQDYIGRLDDIYGFKIDHIHSVRVSSFVFKVDRELDLIPNHEVASLVWLPISYLENANNVYEHYASQNPTLKMPAVLIDRNQEQILWGLTLRMLSQLYQLLDLPMAVFSQQQRKELLDIQNRNITSKEIKDLRKNRLKESV